MRTRFSFLPLLVILVISARSLDTLSSCDESQYCSVGKLAPFTGDLYPNKPVRPEVC